MVDSETLLCFAQEIEVLKTIWGPRIAAFLDTDAEAEQPWLATEIPVRTTRRSAAASSARAPELLRLNTAALHVRYQPSPGPIHFRLITEAGRIRVGYAGRKRPADGVPRRAR